MLSHRLAYNLLVLVVLSVKCQEQDIQQVINSIFSTSSPVTSRPGFDRIVTPEPIVGPTTQPQIFEVDGSQCLCVPYYLCDPDSNTIRTDGEIDGFGLIDIRFDPMTCQDVLDVCCKEDKTKTEPINPKPIAQRPGRATGCGIRNVGGIDFKITGNVNNEAEFGEFPWTVELIEMPGEKCLCGGSLIHPNVVLTGNHCVSKFNRRTVRNLKVRAGEWDSQTIKERLPYQERVATRIISHPQYNPKSLTNDIALIVFDTPFELADHINPICLPAENQLSNSKNCFATGWGKDVFGKAGKYSVIMKRVPLPIVPNNVCEASLKTTRLGPKFRLSPTFICAGGEVGIDTCQGDGGAPLVCPVGPPAENRYAQNGIVAWGIGCNENHPAVYANVALARRWIDDRMNELGFGTASYTY